MIDLRSDTVTKPTPAMLDAMVKAPLGDDVWGDDPTVNRLEAMAAELLAKEAAIYVSSGTQSNLVALLSHCQRGDEYIVGQDAHTYQYEGGGAAVLGSIQPQPLTVEKNGTIELEHIRQSIKPDDVHFAHTRLLCLENTATGRVLPMEYIEQASKLAEDNGLKIHLDGARVYNAAVKLGIDVKDISQYFDSVSVCLSKGLGAPIGSVLCGSAELISKARRWRKMLGGGMRQAGVIAAAGIYALENNIERLREDHDNAALLGQELAQIEEVHVDLEMLQTNMVFMTPLKGGIEELATSLQRKDILVDARKTIRLVTHLQVSREDILTTVSAIKDFYQGSS